MCEMMEPLHLVKISWIDKWVGHLAVWKKKDKKVTLVNIHRNRKKNI